MPPYIVIVTLVAGYTLIYAGVRDCNLAGLLTGNPNACIGKSGQASAPKAKARGRGIRSGSAGRVK